MAYTEVEIFIPAGQQEDAEREEFLETVAALRERGYPLTVYVRDEDAWAFRECEHVADMLEASGEAVLPITLLGPQIVVSWMYPTEEQMIRFATAAEPKRRDPRFSSVGAACGPGGAPARAGAAGPGGFSGAPAGFAAALAGLQQKGTPTAAGSLGASEIGASEISTPEIGDRRNLMDDAAPAGSSDSDPEREAGQTGGCCGGACCR